jgi:hypothetical protein
MWEEKLHSVEVQVPDQGKRKLLSKVRRNSGGGIAPNNIKPVCGSRMSSLNKFQIKKARKIQRLQKLRKVRQSRRFRQRQEQQRLQDVVLEVSLRDEQPESSLN